MERIMEHSTASTVTKKHPASVISHQLREELIRILQMGDVNNEGAFTIAIAAQVEKFAVAAREILMTENLAQSDLSSLMLMRKHPMGGLMGGGIMGGGIMGGGLMGGGLMGGGLMGGGLSESFLPPPTLVNNENFGVQAIRQIVDAVRTMGDSPAKLVEALAVARSNNLTDVVTALEEKLGVFKQVSADNNDAIQGPS